MKRLAALLLASTAILQAPGLSAGAPADDSEPFFWVEESGSGDSAATPEEPKQRPANDVVTKGEPRTPMPEAGEKGAPGAPMAERHPKTGGGERYPKTGKGAPGRRLAQDCYPPESMPDTSLISENKSQQPSATAREHRRGEMDGDDGVIEGIYDAPCDHLHRRGGETAGSASGDLHPDDIRRANTLEDRRIPRHSVGSYANNQDRSDRAQWNNDPGTRRIDDARTWRLERGEMLSDILAGWGRRAGYDVVWESEYDYVVRTDLAIDGTFTDAAGEVISSYADANPPISGEIYLSNRVLVINTATGFDGR